MMAIFTLLIGVICSDNSNFINILKRKQFEMDLPFESIARDVCQFLEWAQLNKNTLSNHNMNALTKLKAMHMDEIRKCPNNACGDICVDAGDSKSAFETGGSFNTNPESDRIIVFTSGDTNQTAENVVKPIENKRKPVENLVQTVIINLPTTSTTPFKRKQFPVRKPVFIPNRNINRQQIPQYRPRMVRRAPMIKTVFRVKSPSYITKTLTKSIIIPVNQPAVTKTFFRPYTRIVTQKMFVPHISFVPVQAPRQVLFKIPLTQKYPNNQFSNTVDTQSANSIISPVSNITQPVRNIQTVTKIIIQKNDSQSTDDPVDKTIRDIFSKSKLTSAYSSTKKAIDDDQTITIDLESLKKRSKPSQKCSNLIEDQCIDDILDPIINSDIDKYNKVDKTDTKITYKEIKNDMDDNKNSNYDGVIFDGTKYNSVKNQNNPKSTVTVTNKTTVTIIKSKEGVATKEPSVLYKTVTADYNLDKRLQDLEKSLERGNEMNRMMIIKLLNELKKDKNLSSKAIVNPSIMITTTKKNSKLAKSINSTSAQSSKSSSANPLDEILDLLSSGNDKSNLESSVEKSQPSKPSTLPENARDELISELMLFLTRDAHSDDDVIRILNLVRLVKNERKDNQKIGVARTVTVVDDEENQEKMNEDSTLKTDESKSVSKSTNAVESTKTMTTTVFSTITTSHVLTSSITKHLTVTSTHHETRTIQKTIHDNRLKEPRRNSQNQAEQSKPVISKSIDKIETKQSMKVPIMIEQLSSTCNSPNLDIKNESLLQSKCFTENKNMSRDNISVYANDKENRDKLPDTEYKIIEISNDIGKNTQDKINEKKIKSAELILENNVNGNPNYINIELPVDKLEEVLKKIPGKK